MRLYSEISNDFIQASVRNRVANKLSSAFFDYYRFRPSHQEITSWRNSLRAMAKILDHSRLDDHGILLEYQLPLSSRRLDCMICGRDRTAKDKAVIVELKQWERRRPSDAELLLMTWMSGREREVLHPSVQVGQYQQYLEDTHSVFHEDDPVQLSSCSYLHNYNRSANDPLVDPKFEKVLTTYPVFDADDAFLLGNFLTTRLNGGNGGPVLSRVESSKYRPSRKLMDFVVEAIKTKSPWILLDEQL